MQNYLFQQLAEHAVSSVQSRWICAFVPDLSQCPSGQNSDSATEIISGDRSEIVLYHSQRTGLSLVGTCQQTLFWGSH